MLQNGLKEGHFLGFIDLNSQVVDVETNQSQPIRAFWSEEVTLIHQPCFIVVRAQGRCSCCVVVVGCSAAIFVD